MNQTGKFNFNKIHLIYFLLVPYTGYIVLIENMLTEKSGFKKLVVLMGWLLLLVYQIMILAVNKAKKTQIIKSSKLYKGGIITFIPTILLILEQLVFNSSLSLFFIEETIILLLSLMLGILFTFLANFEDLSDVWPGVLILLVFTICTLYGFIEVYLSLTKNHYSYTRVFFLIAFIVETMNHFNFMKIVKENNDNGKPILKDNNSTWVVVAIIAQVLIWLILPSIVKSIS